MEDNIFHNIYDLKVVNIVAVLCQFGPRQVSSCQPTIKLCLFNCLKKSFLIDVLLSIQIETLDAVAAALHGNILLKIDTQGYERQVLEGGRETLKRARGVLMELPIIRVYAGEWRFAEALEYMESAGFVPAQIQAVGYHGMDPASMVDVDCLFRPLGAADGAQ